MIENSTNVILLFVFFFLFLLQIQVDVLLIFTFRPRLPDYLLDFGHVVLGAVCKRTVNVTNTGWFQASFSVDRKSLVTLKQLGFTVEMPKVVQLPGAPDHETISFEVTFDPRGANLEIGEAEAVMPINVRVLETIHKSI